MSNLLDQDVVFFGTLNCLPVTTQRNRYTNQERLQLIFPRVALPNRKQISLTESVEAGQDKARLALLRSFIDQLKLVNNQHNEHGLIFDLEFFAFLRKPERIHIDRLVNYNRVVMSLDDKYYHGEDANIARAIHKCAALVYEPFKKFKHRAIPAFKSAAQAELEETGLMTIAYINKKKQLAKVRHYIEHEPIVLVDLEGDQLGPRGTITLIQINTYRTAVCYLIDVLEIGDDELKRPDGWIRRLFEHKTQVKVMWGGLQDAANLWHSYKIKVECMLDLQVVEQYYRERLKVNAGYPYYVKHPDPKQPISLETAYKAFDPEGGVLLKFKANQAQHKQNYHVWAERPLDQNLLNYAAFDVASLRPVLKLFLEKLELYKWGMFEAAITKSRLTYEPKVKTCFTCLRTRPIDDFSNNQKKSVSHCKGCDYTGYKEADEYYYDEKSDEPIGRGLDAFDQSRVRLSACLRD
jgi:hypothetical protein